MGAVIEGGRSSHRVLRQTRLPAERPEPRPVGWRDMTQILYVQTAPAAATAIFCEDCDSDDRSGYYDGQRAIERHSEEYPEHQRITWLRREAA